MVSSNPWFQTVYNVSKIQDSQSFETPLKNLQSNQALRLFDICRSRTQSFMFVQNPVTVQSPECSMSIEKARVQQEIINRPKCASVFHSATNWLLIPNLSTQNFRPVLRTHVASRKGPLDGADLPSFSAGILRNPLETCQSI